MTNRNCEYEHVAQASESNLSLWIEKLTYSLARFEVVVSASREATVAHSLGRQPKVFGPQSCLSREAATAIGASSACCRRFAANDYCLHVSLGLTPKATSCRHYVAEKAQHHD